MERVGRVRHVRGGQVHLRQELLVARLEAQAVLADGSRYLPTSRLRRLCTLYVYYQYVPLLGLWAIHSEESLDNEGGQVIEYLLGTDETDGGEEQEGDDGQTE